MPVLPVQALAPWQLATEPAAVGHCKSGYHTLEKRQPAFHVGTVDVRGGPGHSLEDEAATAVGGAANVQQEGLTAWHIPCTCVCASQAADVACKQPIAATSWQPTTTHSLDTSCPSVCSPMIEDLGFDGFNAGPTSALQVHLKPQRQPILQGGLQSDLAQISSEAV